MTFEELYKAYNGKVVIAIRAYMKHIFFSVDTQEDIAQRFWFNLYKLGNTFENEAHFMTYARTSIKNICVSLIRKEFVNKDKLDRFATTMNLRYDVPIESNLIIEELVLHLKDEERKCVIRFMDGNYISHIAEESGITKERIHKLVKNVQKRYIEEKDKRRKIFKLCQYNGN